MRLFSKIENSKDITDKEYVDGLVVKSIDGLSGGTLTSPMTLTGGDSATASKIILTSDGQITDSGTATMLGFSNGNYIVGSSKYPTTFRGKQTRPTWNGNDLALKSDVPTIPTNCVTTDTPQEITASKFFVPQINWSSTSRTTSINNTGMAIDGGSAEATAGYFTVANVGSKVFQIKSRNGDSDGFGVVDFGGDDQCVVSLSGDVGTSGQVLTSQGNGVTPKWTTPSAPNNGTLTIQKNGTNVATFGANQSTNATANITVPTKVSEITNDSGFTTNKGTVTSVAVKMNGTTKGTVTSSGTIDLGTVLTSHQDISGKLDKTTYEVNKTINFGRDGALYIGKFKVYDTNVTCEITSTTSVTYSGKLVIATQNYVIMQMTVYGDAANTVAPNLFIKPSTTSDPYIEIYFKPASWSKNVVHIYGSAIAAEPTDVCTNVSSVPSTATLKPTNAFNSKANLNGGNDWTGVQQFNGGSYYFATANDRYFTVENEDGTAYVSMNTNGLNLDPEELGSVQLLIKGNAGTAGQVLTSQGAGRTPTWTTPPQFTLSGTTLTITE